MKTRTEGAAKVRSIVFGLLFCASALAQPVVWRASTIAGNSSLGNDGLATNASLGRPRHSAYDRSGNLYVADIENNQIRRLGRDGRMVAVAGSGVQGSVGDGGPALQAQLNRPRAVAVEGNQLFIADSGNYRVRVVNLDTGIIAPYAGDGVEGFAGDGGPAGIARFRLISFVALDVQGNLLYQRILRQLGVSHAEFLDLV